MEFPSLQVSKEWYSCSGLGDKEGIGHRLDLMLFEIFPNLSDSVTL